MQANIPRYTRLCNDVNLLQEKTVAAATTLAVHERFIIIESTGTFTITLPYVAEAMGAEFIFWMRVDGGDVTITDRGDSQAWANLVMNDATDHVLLRSDGVSWHATKTGVA